MGKIKIELMTDTSSLLDGTGLAIENVAELAAQGKVTRDSLKADFEAAGKSTKDFNTAIDNTVKKLAEEGKTIDALILKYGGAAKAQKAIAKELIDMAAAGKAGTAQFKELSKVAGELKDTIDDTRGEIKKLSSDTGALDKLAEGGRGLAAAFSLGAGAAALFGEENENVQKTVAKAQGALALLNGAQELATIATTKGGVATGIATAAQELYTLVVGASSGALKAFRLALAATGIGAVIVAIGYLITNWDELTASVNASSKGLEDFTKLRNDAADSAVNEAGKVELLIEKYKNVNTSQKERKQIIEELKAQSPSYFGTLNSEKSSVEDLTAAYGKYTQALIVKAIAESLAEEISKKQIEIIKTQGKSVNESLTAYDKFIVGLSGLAAGYGVVKKAADPAVLAQKNQQEATAKLKGEIDVLTKALQDYLTQLDLLGGDPSAKATAGIRKLVSQLSSIDKKQIEATINEVVAAFRSIGLAPAEQLQLLKALGFNNQAIGKALAEAFNPDVFKDVKIEKIPVTFELKDGIDRRPILDAFGFKVPIGLDISQEELDKAVDATKVVADAVQGYLNDALNSVIASEQKLIDKLDARISKQQEVVAKEQEAANRGSVNNLAIETNKLNKLNEAREKALEKQKKIKNAQLAIDTATQLSSLVTAAAQVFQAYSGIPGGTAISAALIAVMFAAFAGAKVAAFAAANTDEGFREGGYTGDGDPSEVSTRLGNRGYKYHKKEFVMNEELTATHRELFEAFHAGDKPGIIWGLAELLKDTGVGLPDEALPAELAEAKAMHVKVTSEENNSELRLLRTELQEIKSELTDWKNRPVESNTAVGNSLVTKTGNRTVIKTKK